MAIFTLPEIEEQIAAYKAAMLALAAGQSYTIGNRSLTRAELPEIRSQLEWLNAEKTKLGSGSADATGSGPRILPGRPRR